MSRPRHICERALLGLIVCSITLPRLIGQSANSDIFSVRENTHHSTSFEALKEFERAAPTSYVLGEGDELFVDVFGHPELSGKRIIGPDGRITLPITGALALSALSREEALQKIQEAYGHFYSALSIELRIDNYVSNRIFILGRVASPGVLHFDAPPTLLEAITRAGSLPVGGIGADKAALNRCIIFRGREAVVWIDLKSLLKEGNLAYNLQLQRNDVIYIPDSDDQSVYVLGEVQHPGAYRLRPEMTFMEAYAEAGGTTKDGVPDHIQLIRPSRETRRQIALRDLMHPNPGANFVLMDGDIIYVPKRGLAKFGYFLEQFGPASGLAIVGKQVYP